jgi:hypothetical protein
MTSLFFWNSWIKEYRYVWYFLAVIFFLSLAFMWYTYFLGNDGVIHWQHLQEQKVIETTVHSFRLGPFVLDVPGESYAILEYLQGSKVVPNTTASYLFLFITAVGLTVLVTCITAIERIWFYVAVAIITAFLYTLRFEVLGLFGYHHKAVGAIAIALYLIPVFYFNRFRPTTPFVIRLGVFAFITVALAIIIALFSSEPRPFYNLVLTSFTGTFLLCLVFLILVSHEIFASFVYIATQGSGKSIQHLAILTAIYFVNVLLTLAYELKLVTFDFIYLNVFLILTVSAILGIWGFKNRENVYGNIFAFYPLGGFLFLTLAAMCFATIGHQLGNANDAGVFVIRHLILFAHAGYGFIFILYLLANFGQMLADNAPVYKVLYQPTRMPYFTFGLAGFISTLALVIYANWRTYVYNTIGAFYNTAGDFYTLLDDQDYASSFYINGSNQGAYNHRSNYTMGMVKAAEFDFEDAHLFLGWANARRPSQYSLANEGNLYIRESEIRRAISAYQRNLEKEEHPALYNNLAVAFIKLHKIDSAIYYMSLAREHKLTKNSSEGNFFAMAALERIPVDADSVFNIFNNNSPAVLSNAYALSGVLGTPLNIKSNPLDNKQLNLYTATYLNNYILRNVKEIDTVFVREAYDIASDSLNAGYSEALKASLAYAYYHQGNISRALEILAEQVYLSQSHQGKFNYIMGLWALEQNNPALAASYFNFADTYEYKEAPFYHAIALTEAGQIGAAVTAWDSVSIHGDDAQKTIAKNIRNILTISPSQVTSLPDQEKYQFQRYRVSLSDSILFNRINNSFENANYKAQALLDYSKRFFEAGYIDTSIRYYRVIGGLKLTNEELYEEIRHFELRLLASKRDLRALANQINKGIEFPQRRTLEKMYYTALLNEVNGDTVNARKHYTILARYNPYFEDAVLAAFDYFKKTTPEGFKAYNILAEAIQINANSLPLLRAYHDEALRLGLDEFAMSTQERIEELEKRIF